MSDLLKLATAIARGEYHPSHYVEDFPHDWDREDFAEVIGEYADRLRGRVFIMKDAADRIAELEAEVRKRSDFMDRVGYRRCDIPACNCDSWHGGNAEDRLHEIYEALGERVNGKLPVPVIKGLIAEVERLRGLVKEAFEEAWREGESSGITDGHPLGKSAKTVEEDWEYSDARAALSTPEGPRSSTTKED